MWLESRIHFISGLPRSGSTLLAGILRQNPAFHASMSGPLCVLFSNLLRAMSTKTEAGALVSDEQRRRILLATAEAFYQQCEDRTLIFDTNRNWCGYMSLLAELFPRAQVICCLRSPAWILDSIERHIQAAAFPTERIFPASDAETVYTRTEFTLKKGMLALPLQQLRQAWYGEYAEKLIGVRYESLTTRPGEVIDAVYQALGQPAFPHNFEDVEYEQSEFDRRIGMPGFHSVRRRVEPNHRATVLPPELFSQNDRCFWDLPGQNPRGVQVL
jgi:sulfotransferase